MLVGLYIYTLENRPDLKVWHLAELDAEFSAGQAAKITTLDDYRRLEDRPFRQLQDAVYARVPDSERRLINRYSTGSLMDATAYPRNWNRTFELEQSPASGGIVLLHGLSDSPYSMRALGQLLHASGFHVVGLRIPGHGTVPAVSRGRHSIRDSHAISLETLL